MKLLRVTGLSMIEVLAAMVIFSSTAVVLFGWVGQTASRLNSLKAEQTRLFGELAALEYARGINPMLQPSGEVRLDDVMLRWRSELVGSPLDSLAESGGAGDHVVALYRVYLSSERAGVTTAQKLYLNGWRRVRQSKSGLPFDMR